MLVLSEEFLDRWRLDLQRSRMEAVKVRRPIWHADVEGRALRIKREYVSSNVSTEGTVRVAQVLSSADACHINHGFVVHHHSQQKREARRSRTYTFATKVPQQRFARHRVGVCVLLHHILAIRDLQFGVLKS